MVSLELEKTKEIDIRKSHYERTHMDEKRYESHYIVVPMDENDKEVDNTISKAKDCIDGEYETQIVAGKPIKAEGETKCKEEELVNANSMREK